MQAHLRRWFEALRTNFWFLPTLMLLSAGSLALLLLHVDGHLDPGTRATLTGPTPAAPKAHAPSSAPSPAP